MNFTEAQLIDLCSIVGSLKHDILNDIQKKPGRDSDGVKIRLGKASLQVLNRRFYQLAKLEELLTDHIKTLSTIKP